MEFSKSLHGLRNDGSDFDEQKTCNKIVDSGKSKAAGADAQHNVVKIVNPNQQDI